MSTAVTLAAPTTEVVGVAEGGSLGGVINGGSSLHKENALENWEKVKAMMENKKV